MKRGFAQKRDRMRYKWYRLTKYRPYGLYTEIGTWLMLALNIICFCLMMVPLANGRVFEVQKDTRLIWLWMQLVFLTGIVFLWPMVIREIRQTRRQLQAKKRLKPIWY